MMFRAADPVPTMILDWSGSPVSLMTVIDPTLMAEPVLPLTSWFGPKSVRGTHVGPFTSRVKKLVVRHSPPEAPAAYTVLPDASDGSTATELTRPFVVAPCVLPSGPTGTQSLLPVAANSSE